jgi:hypothetical protein
VGEYATPESNEYSDSYYVPADDYPRRSDRSEGYSRHRYSARPNVSARVSPDGGFSARGNPDYIGYGRLRPGEPSWADLGVHSIGGGAAGENRPSLQGRGPRNYVRSDQRLRELICDRLTDDPLVDASDVEILVENGEITLSGSVRDRMMKWRAEDLAEHVTHGALVHNRLRVHRSAGS